jgi:hypothetical protein
MISKFGCIMNEEFCTCDDCRYNFDDSECQNFRKIYNAKLSFIIKG